MFIYDSQVRLLKLNNLRAEVYSFIKCHTAF